MNDAAAPTTIEIGHGAFCWHEVNTRHHDAMVAFYTAVFEWTASPMDVPKGRYTMFQRGADTVGGCLEMTEEWPAEVPDHWQSYIQVDDVRSLASKVESLGGAVVVPPFDIPIGTMSVVQDPRQGTFSMLTGGDRRRPVGVGCIMHNELISPDLGPSLPFYEQLLGWTATSAEVGGQDYHMFMQDDAMRAGAIAAPPDAPLPCNMWLPYVQVEDVDATVAAITAHGGQVMMPPMDIPTVGRICVFTDPHGAMLAIWTPAEV